MRELGTVEGFDIRAQLVDDPDSDDEWYPYAIIVTAQKGDQFGSASLWTTDETALDGDGEDFAHGYGPDLIAEAIADAQNL